MSKPGGCRLRSTNSSQCYTVYHRQKIYCVKSGVVCRISKISSRREQWSLQNMTYHFWIQLNILQCTFIHFHTNLRMFSVDDYEVSLILILHINGKLIFICNELFSSKTFFSCSNVLVHLQKWGNIQFHEHFRFTDNVTVQCSSCCHLLLSLPQHSHFSLTMWCMQNMSLTAGPVTSKSALIIPNSYHLWPMLIFKQYWTQYCHVDVNNIIRYDMTLNSHQAGLPSNAHLLLVGAGYLSLPWHVGRGWGAPIQFPI
jgi:hypothetical protein